MNTIPLTEKHIHEGVRGNPERCPVALALKEYFGDRYSQILVTGEKIVLKKHDGTDTVAGIDDTLQKQLKQFDETGEGLEPQVLVGWPFASIDSQPQHTVYRRP